MSNSSLTEIMMSSKVRIHSSDTPRVRELEQNARQMNDDTLNLRKGLEELRAQMKFQDHEAQELSAVTLPELTQLKTDILRLHSDSSNAEVKILGLRTRIMTALGCEMAEESLRAITNVEFSSLLKKIKLSRAKTVEDAEVPVAELEAAAEYSEVLNTDVVEDPDMQKYPKQSWKQPPNIQKY
ncbi:hypothetical protein F5880DRAFT_1503782 [Lentinula raphanica]|nr:hypothetical protein F5880DRAFT_1503782 [Lentinula raphanica]